MAALTATVAGTATDSPTISPEPSVASPAKRAGLAWHDVRYSIPLPRAQRKAAVAAQDNPRPERVQDAAEKGEKAEKLQSERTILDGLSGRVDKGEMVAILGASGAGKTTLLNVLSARLDSTGTLSGSVTFKNAKRNPATWKKTLGFVEQDDLMYAQLTVQETLEYSAALRLPSSKYSKADKKHRAADVLDVLRLDKCKDTRIGDGAARGVSGGERKRTSIGVALVADVECLMLDEPTSGLDSFAALNVAETMKVAAKERDLACLMTIHQPSYKIFSLFDRVILLSQGSVFYSGPPAAAQSYFDRLGYPVPEGTNPADWFITIAENNERSDEGDRRVKQLIKAWASREGEQQRSNNYAPEKSDEGGAVVSKEKTQWALSWWEELWTLSRRDFQQLTRNPYLWFGALGQNIVLLILIGFAFFRLDLDQSGVLARIGVLFFIPINTSFSAVFPILAVFPLQRLISIRERSAGAYRASNFYLSKIINEVPSQGLQHLPFIVVVYWMMDLKSSGSAFAIWLAINYLQLLTAIGLGLAIGAGVPNIEAANIVTPLVNVVFLLFGGNLLPLSAIPGYFVWLHYISPLTYAYQALTLNEFTGLKFSCDGTTPTNSQCYPDGASVISRYDLATFTIAENVAFLIALSAVFLLIGYFLFLFMGKPRWRFI